MAALNSTRSDLPLRQVTRLRAEMSVAHAQVAAALFPKEAALAVEFGSVARTCLPDWSRGGVVAPPAAPEHTITVRQLASSLGGSFDTTRRRINQLRDRDLLVVSARGVALGTSAVATDLATRYYEGVHDLFLRTIADIAATCDLDHPVGEAPLFGAREVIERGIDTLLLPIDTFRPKRIGNAFLLWGALTVVAVRDVTYDPVLCRRYANIIPPDALRHAVSLRQLADALAIPYATAWRQISALQGAGLVTRVGSDQWTVLTANLLQDSVRDVATMPSVIVLRRVRELARLGLDPRRAGDLYRHGRPPLARVGGRAADHSPPISTPA